ncbi:hypothetical protein C7271_07445 [filamentous cyanobacterium CCP5]|nr:hypothetical protein C7271_07445 [filamentous cyanobacterium CCP5]
MKYKITKLLCPLLPCLLRRGSANDYAQGTFPFDYAQGTLPFDYAQGTLPFDYAQGTLPFDYAQGTLAE